MQSVYSKCAKAAIFAQLQQGLEPFVYWHVTESIQEGYSPAAIGELQEELEVEEIVLERRSDARDRALGHFVSLLHHYRSSRAQAGSADDALISLESDLENLQSSPPFDDFRLDTTAINDYVYEERQNAGLIAQDPDWQQLSKVSSKYQWGVEFKHSLELTRIAYIQACSRFEHRFTLGTEADLELIELLDRDQLCDLASRHAAKPRHIPAPPPGAADASPPTSSFWSQRIASASTASSSPLPEFEEDQLIQTGRQFRAACLEDLRTRQSQGVRTSRDSKEITVVLSKALNPDTNPERLIQRAGQRYDPAQPSDADDAPQEEVAARSAKDLLSSALRILKERDGERNVSLRIDAHNLRGLINLRLAALKPRTEANYLNRAIVDWTASIELDEDQPEIRKQLSGAKARLESSETRDIDLSAAPSSDLATEDSSFSTRSQGTSNTAAATDDKNSKNGEAVESSKAEGSNGVARTAGKAREKMILESPFFRADLVTGMMVDALLALAFPHRAMRETLRLPSAAAVAAASQDHVHMLERLAKAHTTTVKALTPENKAQLKHAVKTVGAVLALPELQQVARHAEPSVRLRSTSLRLVLGTILLLLNDHVRALGELNLVSNALKPNPRTAGSGNDAKGAKGKAAESQAQPRGGGDGGAEAEAAEKAKKDQAEEQMQARVQGETLLLLAKTCWLSNKVQEAVKFFRWFVKWYADQQAALAPDTMEQDAQSDAAGVSVPELDMRWWDALVVVQKS